MSGGEGINGGGGPRPPDVRGKDTSEIKLDRALLVRRRQLSSFYLLNCAGCIIHILFRFILEG